MQTNQIDPVESYQPLKILVRDRGSYLEDLNQLQLATSQEPVNAETVYEEWKEVLVRPRRRGYSWIFSPALN